jgi:hypothetical protein
MSDLDAPRIHFFAKYFANPSTINNNLSNYALKPPLILSWNPDGSAFFRFLECRVSSAVRGDGTVLSSGAGDRITHPGCQTYFKLFRQAFLQGVRPIFTLFRPGFQTCFQAFSGTANGRSILLRANTSTAREVLRRLLARPKPPRQFW